MVELMETFKRQEKLHRKYAFRILLDVMAYFEAQPSMVSVDIPPEAKFTVCGDIHGQFYDLMNVFSLNGLPSESNPYVSSVPHIFERILRPSAIAHFRVHQVLIKVR
jgi:serine/threonine-protein phosphatase 5